MVGLALTILGAAALVSLFQIDASGPWDDLAAVGAALLAGAGLVHIALQLSRRAATVAGARVLAVELQGISESLRRSDNATELKSRLADLEKENRQALALVVELIALGAGGAAEQLRAATLELEVLLPEPVLRDPHTGDRPAAQQ